MAAPGFWDNQETAQETVGELKSLKAIVNPMTEMIAAVDDLSVLMEMGQDDSSIEPEIVSEIDSLEKQLDDLELKSLLNGPHDGNAALLSDQRPRWRNRCQRLGGNVATKCTRSGQPSTNIP